MLGQTKKILLVSSVTVSVLVLFRVITISPVIVDKLVSWCTYPFIVAQHSIVIPLQQMVTRRKTVEELTKLLEKSKQELEEIRAENIALQATKTHLEQTEEMAAYQHRYKTGHAVLAQVMLKHIAPEQHFCIVDAGRNRGIVEDMIAVYNNCLVGRVVEVHQRYAKVLLITDHMSKVPVICVSSKTQGIHTGANALAQTQLQFVSHLHPLHTGDLLISSGDGLVYPKGFALGKIKDLSLDSLGLNYIVSVEPLLNMRELHHCYLVEKGAEYKE
jgi:rod shape-determining protein MreC